MTVLPGQIKISKNVILHNEIPYQYQSMLSVINVLLICDIRFTESFELENTLS